MSGELEAAGAMATAGLAAGAIEGREPTEAGEGACLNCGAQLYGRFCAQCGQVAVPHRSLLHLGEEILHGLFQFDTKVWRTLPMVLFRPGTLTRNYVYGKRARYISPLTLFLLSIFFLFFVFSLIPPPVNTTRPQTPEETAAVLREAHEDVRQAQDGLDEMRREFGPNPSPQQRRAIARLERILAGAQSELARREAAAARAQAQSQAEQAASDSAETPAESQPQSTAPTPAPGVAPTPPAPPTPGRPPGLHVGASVDPSQVGPRVEVDAPAQEGETPSPYPPNSLEDNLWRASQADWDFEGDPALIQRIKHKLENPPLLLYRLQEAASKFSFLLVPLSLPFIGFLFLFKRNITFYDHTVFALYSLSFASLLCVAMIGFGSVSWLQWLPGTLVMFGLPVHTYFHLKGAYSLRWWSALWRTLFVLTFALIVMLIYLAIILAVGFSE